MSYLLAAYLRFIIENTTCSASLLCTVTFVDLFPDVIVATLSSEVFVCVKFLPCTSNSANPETSLNFSTLSLNVIVAPSGVITARPTCSP